MLFVVSFDLMRPFVPAIQAQDHTRSNTLAWRRSSFNTASARLGALSLVAASAFLSTQLHADSPPIGTSSYETDILPILREYCHDCHGDGAKKGDVSLDSWSSADALLADHDLWWKVLQNVRAGLMPPPKRDQPDTAQKEQLVHWIKESVFRANPANPDPGRITLRRLNRTEYQNTLRDLLGVEFDAFKAFPPDDTGHGFDNIADVLTLSPMHLEKFLAAANTAVADVVPSVPKIPAENVIMGARFEIQKDAGTSDGETTSARSRARGPLILSYYQQAIASTPLAVPQAGRHILILNASANERHVENQFDYNKCRLIFRIDGEIVHSQEYSREGNKTLRYEFEVDWSAGEHQLAFEIEPLTPDEPEVRSLNLRILNVTIKGPMEEEHWVTPENYARFFPKQVPHSPDERRIYAREILEPFVHRAHRRPPQTELMDRIVDLAESIYSEPGKTFEFGIRQAMAAVLASPRFLFRDEGIEPGPSNGPHRWIDEHALASRLSYLFWSSMPDDELFKLAKEGSLRANLTSQVQRLLADPKSEAFFSNFVGQWLQTRDVETLQIDARQVIAREAAPDPDFDQRRARFRALRDKPANSLTDEDRREMDELRQVFTRRSRMPVPELTGDLRRAMRLETESVFEYIVREDRNLIELIDSDYTFLNERLARHYGLTNITVAGDAMQRVTLPPDSPRGGILTHGSVLAVTSNPTRTSPVKRGLFVLENLLGTPPPPPPPDITPLEDAARNVSGRTPSLRETLELHREQPLCSSCHDRMDPIGLALENFNPLGLFRSQERGMDIDPSGTLLTGEAFSNAIELKRILATNHASAFYRTVTEKLLTYALGRGLEYSDVVTVDSITAKVEASDGRPSALLAAIVESAPFQKVRVPSDQASPESATHSSDTQASFSPETQSQTQSQNILTP